MKRRSQSLTHRLPDGCLLTGNYHAPMGEPSGVLLLVRTIWERRAFSSFAQAMSAFGHAVLVQSVRGRHGSSGVFLPYRNEGADGAAMAELLTASPLVANQRLVLVGEGLYDAQAALLAAGAMSPGLLTGLALVDASDDLFLGGLCTQGVLTGLALQEAVDWSKCRPGGLNAGGFWRWLPGISPLAEDPVAEHWALALRDSFDGGGVWALPGCRFRQEALMLLQGLDTLLLSGRRHPSCGGGLRLASRLLGAPRLALSYVQGDWGAAPSLRGHAEGEPVHFLQEWLMRRIPAWRMPGKVAKERNIHYFMRDLPFTAPPARPEEDDSAGTWMSDGALVTKAASRTLYLHFGALSPRPPVGTEAARSAYIDEVPLNLPLPARTPLGLASARMRTGGDSLRRWTPDECVFCSASLPEDTAMAAPMRLHLWCSFSRHDAIVAARLYAEAPRTAAGVAPYPGEGVLLARGIARAGYRYGTSQLVETLPNGAPVELVIPFLPASWRLPRGFRLRLEVGACEAPLWLAPPNPDARSPTDLGLPTRTQVCLWHDATHPSRLVY